MIIVKEDLFMKEKRYYCDWALSPSNKKSNRLISKVLLISLVVVTLFSSLIYYNIMMYNHGEDLEAYSESAYKSHDGISDNVIGKDFEVLSKEPNYSSKEEYIESHKMGFYICGLIFGALTWSVMAATSCIVMLVALPISMVHKKKENLS